MPERHVNWPQKRHIAGLVRSLRYHRHAADCIRGLRNRFLCHMIAHRIQDFGKARLAVAETRYGQWWLTVTKPLKPNETPDWIALDRILIQPGPVPEAS